MNKSIDWIEKSCEMLMLVALTITVFACAEDKVVEKTDNTLEIGKPLELIHEPNQESSYRDIYFGMDIAFYIPPGIEELKNRPFMFTLSTRRNSSVAGSLLPILKEHGIIAISPLNGGTHQFAAFFQAMVDSEYIDPTQVYMSGFSNGGREIFDLAWAQQDQVKGVILLDPAGIYAAQPTEDSQLSICIVCQTDWMDRYELDVYNLNELGIRSKMIAVDGLDHFGILSTLTIDEKTDCFNFVSE